MCNHNLSKVGKVKIDSLVGGAQHYYIGDGCHGNALVAGSTGAGKSSVMSSIITQLCKENDPNWFDVVLMDGKSVEYAFLNGISKKVNPVISAVFAGDAFSREASIFINSLAGDLSARMHEFQVRGVSNWTEYYESIKCGDVVKFPMRVIVIDEFRVYLEERADDYKGRVKAFSNILKYGKSFGIHTIVSARSVWKDFPVKVHEYFDLLFVLRSTEETSLTLLEHTMASDIEERHGKVCVRCNFRGDEILNSPPADWYAFRDAVTLVPTKKQPTMLSTLSDLLRAYDKAEIEEYLADFKSSEFTANNNTITT